MKLFLIIVVWLMPQPSVGCLGGTCGLGMGLGMGGLGCGVPFGGGFGGGFGGLGGFGFPGLYSPFGLGGLGYGGGLGLGMPLCCGGMGGLGYGGLIGKRSIKESELNITRSPTRMIFKRRIPLARLRTITFTTNTKL